MYGFGGEEDDVDEYFRVSYSRQSLKSENMSFQAPDMAEKAQASSSSSKKTKTRTKKRGKASGKKHPLQQLLLDEEYTSDQPESTIKTVLKLFSPKETSNLPRGRPGEGPTAVPMRVLSSVSPKKRFRGRRKKSTMEVTGDSEVHKLIGIRGTYLEKLHDFVFPQGDQGPARVFSSEERRIFAALLVAYRNLSIKIISMLRDKDLLPFTPSEEEDLEQYVREMATSLDWLAVPEVTSWLCLDPVENPLLSYYTLSGHWAVREATVVQDFNSKAAVLLESKKKLGYVGLKKPELHPSVTTVPSELALSPDALKMCRDLGAISWKLFYGEVKEMEDKMNDRHAHIDGVKGVLIGMAEDMHVTGAPRQGIEFFFADWKRKYLIGVKIRVMEENRQSLTKRRVLDCMQGWASQCYGYRALQLRVNTRHKRTIFNGWVVYLLWCQKFNDILSRVSRRRVSRYFEAWTVYEKRFQQKRNFLKNNRKRLLLQMFRYMKYFVVLKHHSMNYRLRTASGRSFVENFARLAYFKSWRRLVLVGKAMRSLNSLLVRGQVQRSLLSWKHDIWPPKPKVPLKDRIRGLRDVATLHAQKAYNHLSVVAGQAKRGALSASVKSKNYIMSSEAVRIATMRPKYTPGELQVFHKQREDLRRHRVLAAKKTTRLSVAPSKETPSKND